MTTAIQNSNGAVMPQELPIFETVKQGYGFIWAQKFTFMKLAFLPLLLFVFVKIYLNYDAEWSQTFIGLGAEVSKYAQLLLLTIHSSAKGILFALIVTMFSVLWHRHFLINNENQTVANLFKWRERHSRFLMTAIVFAFAGYLLTLPSAYLIKPFVKALVNQSQQIKSYGVEPYLFVIVSGLMLKSAMLTLGAVIAARWCLMFPAIAVDNFLTFRQSWRLSSGHGLRLAGILMLSSIPIQALADFIRMYVLPGLTPILGRYPIAISSLLFEYVSYFIILALGISSLSAAHQALHGNTSKISRV